MKCSFVISCPQVMKYSPSASSTVSCWPGPAWAMASGFNRLPQQETVAWPVEVSTAPQTGHT
ncbi:MAG: hypothetical protein ACLRWF_00215 [Ruthenibacterium sp.]